MKPLHLILATCIVLGGCNIFDEQSFEIQAGQPCEQDGDRINGLECKSGTWVVRQTPPVDQPVDLPEDMSSDTNPEMSGDMPQDITSDLGMDQTADIPPDMNMDMMADLTSDMPADMMQGPRCGNGVVEAQEQCDDGDLRSADGCQETCQIETGWTCPPTGGECAPICGDGRTVGPEGCDDGEKLDGDGCSATCTIEPNWRCMNQPSTCLHDTWGNGVLDAGEDCDDGNLSPGDGCSTDAKIEPAYICPTPGQACQRVSSIRRTTRSTPTSQSSFPPHSSTSTGRCYCADNHAFLKGIGGNIDNQDLLGFTATRCSQTSVDNMGNITTSGGAGVGWFNLHRNGPYVKTECPDNFLLSKIKVYLSADDERVEGVEVECSKYAILNGKLTKQSTTVQKPLHGKTTTNSYETQCPTNQMAFGYHGLTANSTIARLGLMCFAFVYDTM